tara:strand:+ start:883 stop:1164 length:282 start_codon:yes stop_codon:yes gene_type:complete
MKNKFIFIVLLVIPVLLLLLPSSFFDSGESVCLSVSMFDKECYACGMTRAIQHLLHLDFVIAYQFNKLSVIVFPLLIISYFKELKKYYFLSKI